MRRQLGMNENIIITGSTGVIGRRAVREVLAAGYGVTGVTRTDPATNAEIDAALAAAVGVGVGTLQTRAPQGGPLARSQRVSNRRLRDASGWAPAVRAATESWGRIVA